MPHSRLARREESAAYWPYQEALLGIAACALVFVTLQDGHTDAISSRHRKSTSALPRKFALPAVQGRLHVDSRPARPTVLMIGSPKAGTTTLHKCLVSSFTPAPCCAALKEPFLSWASTRNTSRGWPTVSRALSYPAVLDFTPNYLSQAASTVARLRAVYGRGRGIHIVVGLRDPVDRAFSEHCMFTMAPLHVVDALRTRGACSAYGHCRGHSKRGRCTAHECMNDTGWINAFPVAAPAASAPMAPAKVASLGPLFREFHAARHAIAVLLGPQTVTAGGEVNRTAVYTALRDDKTHTLLEGLSRLVIPWVDPACGGSGWGTEYIVHGTQSFEEMMAKQLVRMRVRGTSGERRHNCSLPPSSALSLAGEELEAYVLRCFRLGPGSYAYAAESVPVFQLALFMRSFPEANWTFIQFEHLFSRTANVSLLQLGQRLFSFHPKPASQAHETCLGAAVSMMGGVRHSSARSLTPRYNRSRLDALFAPWYRTLLELVLRSNSTLVGWDGAAAGEAESGWMQRHRRRGGDDWRTLV
jgi:hypothetical protein